MTKFIERHLIITGKGLYLFDITSSQSPQIIMHQDFDALRKNGVNHKFYVTRDFTIDTGYFLLISDKQEVENKSFEFQFLHKGVRKMNSKNKQLYEHIKEYLPRVFDIFDFGIRKHVVRRV